MLYVLRQRLVAQAIEPAKAEQVLNDVIGAMFTASFVEELFKPHPLYSFEATKNVFERLAHCSIMKLNETSMSKLYDLMTMVFKWQLTQLRSPGELLPLTRRHLSGMAAMTTDANVKELVAACAARLDAVYGGFSSGNLCSLRHTLFDFVQGRNVKVSLLLQENLQGDNGKMFIRLDGPCARETPLPGTVRHFDAEASVSNEYKVGLSVLQIARPEEFSEQAYAKVHALVGANLYALFRSNGQVTSQQPAEEAKQAEAAPPVREVFSEELKRQAARDELNLLASLIVPRGAAQQPQPQGQQERRRGSSSGSAGGGSFRLNPFQSSSSAFSGDAEEPRAAQPAGSSKQPDDDDAVPFILIDAGSQRRTLQQQMDDLDLDVGAGRSRAPEEKRGAESTRGGVDDRELDLLDLMDQAVAADKAKSTGRRHK